LPDVHAMLFALCPIRNTVKCPIFYHTIPYVNSVIPSSANVTHARWKFTNLHQIAGYVTRLNVGVPQPATRWS